MIEAGLIITPAAGGSTPVAGVTVDDLGNGQKMWTAAGRWLRHHSVLVLVSEPR